MARKPRDYKAEYARRIARAMQKGKTRQQARGHKPKEHIARKEREIAEHGLTLSQTRTVFNWASKRSFEIKDHEIDPLEIVDHARQEGYDWFKNYRMIWDAARRTYLREVRNKTYASRGMGYLTELTERANAPELSWLYYH